MKPLQSLTALAVTFALALSAPGIAAAQSHAHGGQAELELVLNNGAKWQGDQTMIDGMSAIRAAMAENLDAIHNGTLGADGAGALAAGVQKQVDFMVENCVLEPEVDEQLHAVLGEVLIGVGDLENGEIEPGAVTIVEALNAYGAYFEHPGWQNLE